jgi:hypothetical protein
MRMDCFPCIQLQKPVALQETPPAGVSEGLVAKFIRRYYAPFLLRKEVKQLVVAAFGGLFLLAIVGMQRITMGLGELHKPVQTFDSNLNTAPSPDRPALGFAIRFSSYRLLQRSRCLS